MPTVTRDRQILILLNGPAGAGKDKLAEAYRRRCGAVLFHPAKFSRDFCSLLLGFEMPDEFYAEKKDTPLADLGNKSIREVMIKFSEDFIKPNFGKTFFVDRLIKRMQNTYTAGPAIVTSIGFPSEVRALINSGFAHKKNILLVHIDRFRKSFDDTDSRAWVSRSIFPEINYLHIKNDDLDSIEGPLNLLAGRVKQMSQVNF